MDVSPAQLRRVCYESQFDRLVTALASRNDEISPNVAIVAPPFGGRDLLLEFVEEQYDPVARIETGSDPGITEAPRIEDHGSETIVLVPDAQFLFTRDIGGYEPLTAFLENAALSEPAIVTAWNSYAWDYLDAVRDVSQSFERVVRLGPVDAVDLASLLEAHHDAPAPDFVQTAAHGHVKTVAIERSDVSLWGDRSVELPTVDLNPEYLLSRGTDEVVGERQAVVYQKLVQVSGGNPGVAAVLWDESIREGEIAPSYVPETDAPLSLDREAAFVLELVVSNGRIERETLSEIRPTINVDQALQTLSDQGVVTVDGSTASLRPQRLRAAVDHLEGRQLLW